MIVCETGDTQCHNLNLWINILKVWIPELVIKEIIMCSVSWEDYSFIYDTQFTSFMYLFRKSPQKAIKNPIPKKLNVSTFI